MSSTIVNPHDVIDFWFEELEPAQWWVKDDALDQHINERFGVTHKAATLAGDTRRAPG